MVSIEGGCYKCGRLSNSVSFDPSIDPEPKIICKVCYEYYSLGSIRERKIHQVLSRKNRLKIFLYRFFYYICKKI